MPIDAICVSATVSIGENICAGVEEKAKRFLNEMIVRKREREREKNRSAQDERKRRRNARDAKKDRRGGAEFTVHGLWWR